MKNTDANAYKRLKTRKNKSVRKVMTTDNNRKKIGFSFMSIAVACVFLFNANINIIDLVPDIIGYLIICVALLKLSNLNEDVAQAAKFFRYVIISELAKLVCLVWVFGLASNDERNTGTLLLAFAFAVIDTIILVNAFNKLFGGLISLGYAHKNTSILGSKRVGGRSYTEKIRSSTVFFVVFKACMATLPEFSNLVAHDYDESSGLVELYEYIGVMRVLSFIIVTVAGIVWIVKIFRYFARVNKDVAFRESLADSYEKNILPKRGLFVKRDMGIAFFILSAASVFMLDFRLEYLDMIPDFLGAVLFLVGMLICARQLRVKKMWLITAGLVYLLSSIASYVVEIGFFNKYYYGAVYRDTGAYNYYVTMCAASVIEMLGFCAIVAALIYCFRGVITEHTGFVLGTDISGDGARIETYQRESKRRLIFLAVGGLFAVATDVFYTFFAIKTGYAGAISVLGTLVFIISVIKTTQDIAEEINIKYMLD